MPRYSQDVISKVQKCYENMLRMIEEIGSKIEMGLTFMEEYEESDPARYQVGGKLVSSADMIRMLRLYSFACPVHHGASFFLQWQTEKGEDRIRTEMYNALNFLRHIPLAAFDEDAIDHEVWEFIKDRRISEAEYAAGMSGGLLRV